MRKIIFPLAAIAVALVVVGCTGPEQKLGRGLSNTYEIVRWGEFRRSVELNGVEPLPSYGYYGFIHGIDRTFERTGLGIAETLTFPIPTPTYGPMCPKFYGHAPGDERIDADPVHPSSYTPGHMSDAIFDTDTFTGFSGGDVAPWAPGSRFSIWPN
jgi:putative exosortase-associated protein (TIGR04073 family)